MFVIILMAKIANDYKHLTEQASLMKRDDRFRIFVEQLRHGHTETISESFEPDFLEVDEPELKFVAPVDLEAEAYVTENELVLHLTQVHTTAEMPCRICNQPVRVGITIRNNYQTIPMEEVRGGIFDFRELLREVVLLEVPSFVECSEKGCPERKALKRYFKEETETKKKNRSKDAEESTYHPFADL